MTRLLRDRDVRRLACILVGCAVAWQLWRWTPMLRPWVTTWLTEGEEPPPGKSSGAAADPWAAFTPQTLLPLVLYVAGAVVVLLLVSRIRHRPGFRWTTVGSLQVLSLLIGFAVSGWQQVLGLENVQGVDHWFANPRDVGLEWLAAPLSSCLLTGGYGRRLGTSRRRSRAGLTDRQIWLAVLVPAALVAGVVACAVPFLSGVMLVPVVPMLALYCVGMWFLLHAVRGLPGLRTDLLVLINCLVPVLAVAHVVAPLLLDRVPGLNWLTQLPWYAFGASSQLFSGVGITLNGGHYGLLPIAESLIVLFIYLRRLRAAANRR